MNNPYDFFRYIPEDFYDCSSHFSKHKHIRSDDEYAKYITETAEKLFEFFNVISSINVGEEIFIKEENNGYRRILFLEKRSKFMSKLNKIFFRTEHDDNDYHLENIFYTIRNMCVSALIDLLHYHQALDYYRQKIPFVLLGVEKLEKTYGVNLDDTKNWFHKLIAVLDCITISENLCARFCSLLKNDIDYKDGNILASKIIQVFESNESNENENVKLMKKSRETINMLKSLMREITNSSIYQSINLQRSNLEIWHETEIILTFHSSSYSILVFGQYKRSRRNLKHL